MMEAQPPPIQWFTTKMMRQQNNKVRTRTGLTLIELLVVLTILIALGGIVVSSLPGLLGKTQTATAAANVPEIDSAIRRQMVTSNGLVGNRFDSLVTGTTGINGDVANYVGGSAYFQSISLSESDIQALNNIGLRELIPASATPSDATFDSHSQPAVALGTDAKVCAISDAFAGELMERIWNLTPTDGNRYLVFGLGAKSSLVGGSETALFSEAPVHFSDEANSSPANMYSRYLLVVELKMQSGSSASSQSSSQESTFARYVGIAIPDVKGLRGINQELQQSYGKERTPN